MNSLYTDNNNIIIINKSVILPITSGTINVDTTESITIFMKNPSKTNDILRINKIPNDNYNPIILFCDSEISNVNIDNNHIIFFGLNPHSSVEKGKNTTIILKATSDNNWTIINSH